MNLAASIDPDSLSDDEALEMANALAAVEAYDRFEAVARTFPETQSWPPDYAAVTRWREGAADILTKEPRVAAAARRFYRDHLASFIEHWCITYDPRNSGSNKPARMPFILFQRQREFVDFLLACIKGEESGLVEKCRDMGATWVASAFSVGLWLFWPGASVGWGSRKEQLVDKLGDPDSIFEKMRMIVRSIPAPLLPIGFSENDHLAYMKFLNVETGATITGEAGSNIGRGGRKLIYFKDESAHYERAELIEAALADNTRVQIDISSVNGLGNVFYRRREKGRLWLPGEDLEPARTAIFIMDWRDHPEKDQAWYDRRKKKAEDDGLLHIFAQEVDRNYAASVEGTIIAAEWVRSAIGAREKLGIPDRGPWRAALDVADGGGDTNALTLVRGIEIKRTDSWGARDTGETTRRAITAVERLGEIDLQYDSIGVGSGVKAEANRLEDEGKLPFGLRLIPWNAGGKVQQPDEPIIPGDFDSPLNREFYQNLKAQAWWRMRQRFEKTHRAVQALETGEPFTYDPDDLVSIDPTLPQLRQLEKELSQPTASRSTQSLKLVVDKTPDGTSSPNLADSVVMAFNPAEGLRPIVSIAPTEIEQMPFAVPHHWRKGWAMRLEPGVVSILWAAYDPDSDILYITAEQRRRASDPGATALAIKARGDWMRGFVQTDGSGEEERRQTLAVYGHLGLEVYPVEKAIEAGVADLVERVATGRLRAFASCTEFFRSYRSYRRDADGKIVGDGFMDCARILCRPATIQSLSTKQPTNVVPFGRVSNPYR